MAYIKQRPGPGHKRQRGSTILEFAMVLPLLLLLTMGIAQYGLITNATNSVSQISREGARSAAVNALKADADNIIKLRIEQTTASTPLRYSDLAITIEPPENTTASPNNRIRGNPITVTISYDLKNKMFLPTMFAGAARVCTRSGTMMIE